MNQQAPLFTAPDAVHFPPDQIFLKNVIEDRGSKYSALGAQLESCNDPQKKAKLFSHGLKKDNFFKKATHNSYARRCERDDGLVVEGYTDDGEKGAGLCILREMRKAKILNGLILVTRYYGGTKLDGDRFRHVVDATKIMVDRITT